MWRHFYSCCRQRAFGNPPAPLRGPLPPRKRWGRKQVYRRSLPPLWKRSGRVGAAAEELFSQTTAKKPGVSKMPIVPNEFGVCMVYGRCCTWGAMKSQLPLSDGARQAGEALIHSLSAFILKFLCNARYGMTRIASYLRNPMTKQCIKIFMKVDSVNESVLSPSLPSFLPYRSFSEVLSFFALFSFH